MRRMHRKWTVRVPNERGQTMVIVILALGLFLLGAVAFGTDIANLWFHRQAAQTAADAACTAGIMDMLYQSEGINNYAWINTVNDCSGNSTIAPCWYAAKNGYNGADVSTGVPSVKLSYPSAASLSSLVPTCPTTGSVCIPTNLNFSPFFQVNINDSVRVFFAALLNGGKTHMNVGAKAVCAVLEAQSPIPLLVLDPQHPPGNGKNAYAFNVQGTPTVAIWGGPTQSIQVNSTDPTYAANTGGAGSVNLTLGGPPGPGTGSQFGVAAQLAGLDTSGVQCGAGDPNCVINHGPISDPFASYAAPGQPGFNGTVTHVAAPADGCPDATHGCDEYTPGYYPNGIAVKNATAIFQPGLYYLAGGSSGGFTADANSCLRPSTTNSTTYPTWLGTMLYLSGSATVNVDSNSGAYCVKYATAFDTQSGTGVLASGVRCTATSSVPSNMPATMTGNVMLAPCGGPYGDPFLVLGQADPTPPGEQRGILLFQDRSATTLNTPTTGPSWGGSGSFLLAGTMYLHSCNASGTGGPCGDPPTYYSDDFTLQGSSGSATWVLGDIVVDNLVLGGTSSITMDLNSEAAFFILKATLIQ